MHSIKIVYNVAIVPVRQGGARELVSLPPPHSEPSWRGHENAYWLVLFFRKIIISGSCCMKLNYHKYVV